LTDSVRFPRFALLGAGYIGGSAALAGLRAGLVGRAVGWDPNPQALAAALAKGAIHEAAVNPEAAVRDASLVLLAGPVRTLEPLLGRIVPALASGATVVDVGSVKETLVRAAEKLCPAGHFVGGHPMAGAEFSGVDAADPNIFSGRVCFVCAPANARADAVAAAQAFWSGIGCQAIAIDPQVHDRLMAAQSHLPHVAAFALAAALAPELAFLDETTTAASPTTSLRDTTRIAASGPAVWRDILLANAGHVLPLIAQLAARVGELERVIASGDAQELERILAAGRACRQRLVKD
jgi:prephenate dehydrogenase